jgi:hypothetical protein
MFRSKRNDDAYKRGQCAAQTVASKSTRTNDIHSVSKKKKSTFAESHYLILLPMYMTSTVASPFVRANAIDCSTTFGEKFVLLLLCCRCVVRVLNDTIISQNKQLQQQQQ